MPTIGWLIGKAGESFISSVDHWVALILLCFIGGQMIVESLKNRKEPSCDEGPCTRRPSFKTLMLLSLATSIDALATGIFCRPPYRLQQGPDAAGGRLIRSDYLCYLYCRRLYWQKIWRSSFGKAQIAGGMCDPHRPEDFIEQCFCNRRPLIIRLFHPLRPFRDCLSSGKAG